jgi:hypothetical protein
MFSGLDLTQQRIRDDPDGSKLIANRDGSNLSTDVLSHNNPVGPMNRGCSLPVTSDRLPVSAFADLVPRLALTTPLDRKVEKVVTEGDDPEGVSRLVGFDCADCTGLGVPAAPPGEEGEAAGSLSDHGELPVRRKDVGHDVFLRVGWLARGLERGLVRIYLPFKSFVGEGAGFSFGSLNVFLYPRGPCLSVRRQKNKERSSVP